MRNQKEGQEEQGKIKEGVHERREFDCGVYERGAPLAFPGCSNKLLGLPWPAHPELTLALPGPFNTPF